MTEVRPATVLFLGFLLLPSHLLWAEVVVVRDSIGSDPNTGICDPNNSNGQPGGQAFENGSLLGNPRFSHLDWY